MSEPNYQTTKFFTKNLFAIKMKETQILMNKPVYLAHSVVELCNILIYEFWYDCTKAKYDEKQNFIVYIKTDDIYKDIAEDV